MPRINKVRFSVPRHARNLVQRFPRRCDTLPAFINDTCFKATDAMVCCTPLWYMYLLWGQEEGLWEGFDEYFAEAEPISHRPSSEYMLHEFLKKSGFQTHWGPGVAGYWAGLGVRDVASWQQRLRAIDGWSNVVLVPRVGMTRTTPIQVEGRRQHIQRFLQACCRLQREAEVETAWLYEQHVTWENTLLSGERHGLTRQQFSFYVHMLGYTAFRDPEKKFRWAGICMNQSAMSGQSSLVVVSSSLDKNRQDIKEFLNLACESREDALVSRDIVYRYYTDWRTQHSSDRDAPLGLGPFTDIMRELGHLPVDEGADHFWQGFVVIEEEEKRMKQEEAYERRRAELFGL